VRVVRGLFSVAPSSKALRHKLLLWRSSPLMCLRMSAEAHCVWAMAIEDIAIDESRLGQRVVVEERVALDSFWLSRLIRGTCRAVCFILVLDTETRRGKRCSVFAQSLTGSTHQRTSCF